MNDEKRVALEEERTNVVEIIDRAVPEPDADAVERAAKAMYDQSPEMWFSTQMIPYPLWDKAPVYVKSGARIMAHAALAAVPPVQAAAADAPGLDALLDSMHPESAVTAWLESRPEPESGIMAPHFMAKIETHGENVFWGDGTTRISAIKNAVEKAKERK